MYNNQVTIEQAIALAIARTELEVDGVIAADTHAQLILSGIDADEDITSIPTFLGEN